MRRLPQSITILGHTFKVIQDPKLSPEDATLYGKFEGEDEKITINSSLPLETQWRTLFHECIHAAFYVSGWSQVTSHNKEEAMVRLFENAFWPIIAEFSPRQVNKN